MKVTRTKGCKKNVYRLQRDIFRHKYFLYINGNRNDITWHQLQV